MIAAVLLGTVWWMTKPKADGGAYTGNRDVFYSGVSLADDDVLFAGAGGESGGGGFWSSLTRSRDDARVGDQSPWGSSGDPEAGSNVYTSRTSRSAYTSPRSSKSRHSRGRRKLSISKYDEL